MWQKFKEQLPAVVIILLVIAGGVYWLQTRTFVEMSARQNAEFAALRAETNAELEASAEQTRQQIDAVNTLLKDAISKRSSDIFMTDEEISKVNAQKMDELATVIAKKIQPFNPAPKTPEEAADQENQQLDRVSSGIAQRIEPILADLAKNQNVTSDSLAKYSRDISDQISVILTSELEKNQRLNASLAETQAVARESLGLSQELAEPCSDRPAASCGLTSPAACLKIAASYCSPLALLFC